MKLFRRQPLPNQGVWHRSERGHYRTGAVLPSFYFCYPACMIRRLLLFVVLSISMFAADVTGTWHVEVKTDAGSGSPTFVLKQDGDKITGSYSGQLGEAKVTGTVKGDEVTFGFDMGGAAVVYVGKVDAAGKKMTGEVDLAGQASGTFTGEKK